MKGVIKRMAFWALTICLLLGLLYLFQSHMIYFPRRYTAEQLARAGRSVRTLEFKTSQGTQRAYYLPPANGQLRALWICFHGNASTALNWLGLLEAADLKNSGFLLVDYPGYGRNDGQPSPKSILENTEGAVAVLKSDIKLPEEEFRQRLNLLGLSIGTGALMQYAVRVQPRRIILLAPFTSLLEMAKRQFGPLSMLLVHRFDNRARLNELAARAEHPRVLILHGAKDSIIPVEMGRELAQAHPDFVTYQELPASDHNDILQHGGERIIQELAAADSGS